MKQIGGITSQLSRLRFDRIGSLFEESRTYQIKSALSPAFCLYNRDEFRQEMNRGPFAHEREYYESLVSAFLLHVEYLPLEHHIFLAPVPIPDEYNRYADYLSATDRWNDFVTVGSKIDSGKNRLNYVIIGRLLQDIIPSLVEESTLTPTGVGAEYPLCHPDLSVNNIFIDNECNITCIIDWAFSTSVPFSALLVTPGLPHPRDEMAPSLTEAFRSGFEEDQHSFGDGLKIETGRRHAVWDNCRKIWLFTRLVNLDSLQDVCHFTELYTLVTGKEDVNLPTLLQAIQTQEEILHKARSLAAGDESSIDIKRQEIEYFSQVGLTRLALSQKLTLASDISRDFVADQRLWKWLAKAVNLEG
ncbi:hypothetical protein OEA41_008691 [Lepraria neglecta]|uniref:Aminoglycoside phosphotransferase domain-containing protein n=1 Tax=Lepraria neglecta TaxID=209136 RepID=A0AAD9Z2G5_9LECA|nr:hypothetical protein OEA41_008691 [Lepraria neglecta]